MKYKIYCLSEALGSLILGLTLLLAAILTSPFWMPLAFFAWYFEKEEMQYKGYQPTGPSLDTNNPPKGGSAFKSSMVSHGGYMSVDRVEAMRKNLNIISKLTLPKSKKKRSKRKKK